jgi:hypothetical protein
MHQRDHPGPMPKGGHPNLLRIQRGTERRLHGRAFGAGAPHLLGEPLSEHSVDADQRRVPGLDEVEDGGLHAGAAGPRHRDGERVLGTKDRPKLPLYFVHQFQELWVQVTDQRTAHGLQHAGRHVGGPGTHQNPGWWSERSQTHLPSPRRLRRVEAGRPTPSRSAGVIEPFVAGTRKPGVLPNSWPLGCIMRRVSASNISRLRCSPEDALRLPDPVPPAHKTSAVPSPLFSADAV